MGYKRRSPPEIRAWVYIGGPYDGQPCPSHYSRLQVGDRIGTNSLGVSHAGFYVAEQRGSRFVLKWHQCRWINGRYV
jgi:hypothetical protein